MEAAVTLGRAVLKVDGRMVPMERVSMLPRIAPVELVLISAENLPFENSP